MNIFLFNNCLLVICLLCPQKIRSGASSTAARATEKIRLTVKKTYRLLLITAACSHGAALKAVQSCIATVRATLASRSAYVLLNPWQTLISNKVASLHPSQLSVKTMISKKSPTGPAERTPEPEHLTALATY